VAPATKIPPSTLQYLPLLLALLLTPRPHAAGHPTGYNFHNLLTATGSGDDEARCLAIDANGGLHVGGAFEETIHFGTTQLTSAGDTDGFVAHYTPSNSQPLWVQTFASPGAVKVDAIAIDPNGNTIAGGQFIRDLTCSQVTLTNRGPVGTADAFLAKLDPDGNLLWMTQFGANIYDTLKGIAVDSSGRIYATGSFMNTAQWGDTTLTSYGNSDIYLTSLTPEGGVEWATQAGGASVDLASALALSPNGNLILSGSVAGDVDFDDIQLTNALNSQVVVAAADGSGRFLWAHSGGSSQADAAQAVAVDPDNAVTLVGYFAGPAELGSLVLTNSAIRYTFSARFAPDGTPLWLVDHGGQEATSVAALPENGAAVAGFFVGNRTFGTNELVSAGGFDWFILQHNATGGVQWARSAGGTNMDYAYNLQPGPGTALTLAGRATTNATFDSFTLTNAQAFDLLITRVSPAPLITDKPANVVTNAGTDVSLNFTVSGAEPITHQWYHNKTNAITNATNTGILLPEVTALDSGSYQLVSGNAYGNSTSPPVQLTVYGVTPPEVLVNGSAGTNFSFVDLPDVSLELIATFPDADLYYTLDGSQPTFASHPYASTVTVNAPATVRAIGYDATLESAEADPVVIEMHLSPPIITVNDQQGTNLFFTNINPVTVTMTAGMPEATIHYTTSETNPTPADPLYTAPLLVSSNVTLRARTFTSSLESPAAEPVVIHLLTTHELTVPPAPDGSVTLTPPGGVYVSNTVVTATAQPDDGWFFSRWSGDLTDTNPVATVLMDRDKTITPIFGTTVTTAADGKGSFQLRPSGALYARGEVISLLAIPDQGHFFSQWSGTATGTNNPVTFTVNDAEPVVVGSFSPLPDGYFTVTVLTEGSGTVSKAPAANFYTNGTAITLTAVPDADAGFLGWSGDLRSDNNPYVFDVQRSLHVTAHFTGSTYILLSSPELINQTNLVFQLLSEPLQPYELLYTTNLGQDVINWTPILSGTNTTGHDLLTNPIQPSLPALFYRVLTQP
jgi:hypothetical protein